MSGSLKPIIKELGAGLILRRSSPDDAEALSAFCGMIHSDEPGRSDPVVAAWTRDLLTRPHPRFHPDDFTVIEEVATGRIVSTLNLIPQTWTYEGIPFGVGRPELVGTLPEYRHRGLIRLQFEEIHRWSAEHGDMVQAITGIPFYYRLFDYEMALDLDGARSGFEINVPRLEPGQIEPCVFRPAGEADLAFITATYRDGHARYPITCVRDESIWYYELRGRNPLAAQPLLIIERRNGEALGFIRHRAALGKQRDFIVTCYELKPGSSWLEITPAVIRLMWQTGQEIARASGTTCTAFTFDLGESHPVDEVFKGRLPQVHRSYAWYLRVGDLPGFVRHIAPALERRLADSYACGYTGEKCVSFYRSGLRLVFEQGHIAEVAPWQPAPPVSEGDIAFPGLTFLQLLFGYRSLEELRGSFADCWWNSNETRALFEALFPKRPSQVVALS
ncbi:MAG TPA: GNAT family N-acetyltransferase [Anaerolineales bacterium]